MAIQDDQSTRKSTQVCRSGAPPKETLLCIHMRDVASAKATNLVDGNFRSQKTGFEMSIHDTANRWTPKD
jgi:hypothetical protein